MQIDKRNSIFFLISVAALLNIILNPVFEPFGGLCPSEPMFTFSDAVYEIINSNPYYTSLHLTIRLLIFIPVIFMLLTSFLKSKLPFMISSIIGFSGVAILIISFIHDYGMNSVFDFEECAISVGTWIALIIFAAATVFSYKVKYKSYLRIYKTALSNTVPVKTARQIKTAQPQKNFCPRCGKKRKGLSNFCGSCGFNFHAN